MELKRKLRVPRKLPTTPVKVTPSPPQVKSPRDYDIGCPQQPDRPQRKRFRRRRRHGSSSSSTLDSDSDSFIFDTIPSPPPPPPRLSASVDPLPPLVVAAEGGSPACPADEMPRSVLEIALLMLSTLEQIGRDGEADLGHLSRRPGVDSDSLVAIVDEIGTLLLAIITDVNDFPSLTSHHCLTNRLASSFVCSFNPRLT